MFCQETLLTSRMQEKNTLMHYPRGKFNNIWSPKHKIVKKHSVSNFHPDTFKSIDRVSIWNTPMKDIWILQGNYRNSFSFPLKPGEGITCRNLLQKQYCLFLPVKVMSIHLQEDFWTKFVCSYNNLHPELLQWYLQSCSNLHSYHCGGIWFSVPHIQI